jgi:hypothetical protein
MKKGTDRMNDIRYEDLTLPEIRKLEWSPMRKALIEDICDRKSGFNYAATLTFKEEVVSRATAQKYGLRFQQFYNIRYGFPNWKRKSKKDIRKRAPIVAALEDHFGQKHLHYHLALSKPDDISDSVFKQLILESWRRTGNGSIFKNKIEPTYNLAGWAAYITKEITWDSTDVVHLDMTHTFTWKSREAWQLTKARKAGNAKKA